MPELTIEQAEADALGGAIYSVASIYTPSWLTPEMEAWGHLITVAAVIYAPRIIAIRSRQHREKYSGSATLMDDSNGTHTAAATN